MLQSCVLHLTKPLALLKSLQELGLTAELAEKIASVWALNAQSLVSWARGDQTIQVSCSSIELLFFLSSLVCHLKTGMHV